MHVYRLSDFLLQFVWEELYKPTAVCGREVGTLYHLRQCFKLINVPSDVRKNYASCEMLMLSATKSYLCSAFLTWAEIKTTKETPSYVKETMKTDALTRLHQSPMYGLIISLLIT